MTCDETDMSESVYGGVQAYWASEAATVNASQPKFYETKIDLEKLMAFIYIKDEALADIPFMSGLLNNAMATAANRMLEGALAAQKGVKVKLLGAKRRRDRRADAKAYLQRRGDHIGGIHTPYMWQVIPADTLGCRPRWLDRGY